MNLKKLFFIFALISISTSASSQNNLWAPPWCITNAPPTFNPGSKGCRIVLDTTDQTFYLWKIGTTWVEIGKTIDEILGCVPPAYTPTKWQSEVVLNDCDSLYRYRSGVWYHLNPPDTDAQNLSLTDQALDISGGTGVTLPIVGVSAGTGIDVSTVAGVATVSNTGVTSVGLDLPAEFTEDGTPVTTSGTLSATWAAQAANLVFRSGDAGGTPSMSALTAADIPAASASKWTDGGATTYLTATTDNVAIGTTTTSAGLGVLKTTEQLRLSYDASNAVTFTVGAANSFVLKPLVNSTAAFNFTNAAGTTVFDINTTNGRIGVGTSSPQAPAHVTSTSAIGLLFERTGASQNSAIQYKNPDGSLYAGINQSENFSIGSSSNLDLGTFTHNVTTGFTGIGATTPDFKFHVEQDDAVTNAVTYTEQSTHTTSGTATTNFGIGKKWELENGSGTNRVAATQEVTWSDAVDATEDATLGFNLIREGTLSRVMTILSTGNAGIGETAPTARLQVKGSGATSSTTALLVENSAGTDALNVLDNGNAGIGITAPTSLLHTSQSKDVSYANVIGNLFESTFTGTTIFGTSTYGVRNSTIVNISSAVSNRTIVGLNGAITYSSSSAGGISGTGGITGASYTAFNDDAAETVSNTIGFSGRAGASRSGGTVASAIAIKGEIWSQGNVTSGYDFYAGDELGGGGTVTNQYGLYVEGLTKGTNKYAVYTAGTTPSYFAGSVGIGATPVSEKLEVTGNAKITGTLASTRNNATLAAAATTLAITRNVTTVTGDAGGNTLATITGGQSGQILTLIFVDGLVTITDDGSGAANTVNLSSAFTSTAGDVLTLVFDGTSWFETQRSNN